MLFSATQTNKVADLARISLRPGPIRVDVDKEEPTSTVATLSQGYIVCQSDQRFLLLYTFLQKNRRKKVVVFFSSCNSVKYHAEWLNYIDVAAFALHVFSFEHLGRSRILMHMFCRVNKSNKSVPTPFSNSSTPPLASFCARMSPREV